MKLQHTYLGVTSAFTGIIKVLEF